MNQNQPDENSAQHELTELRRQNAELKAGLEKKIAEQKQAEENLRQFHQKYLLLFEKSAIPTSLSTFPNGIIVEANEAFQREFGYTKQQAVGKTIFDLGITPGEESRKRILATLRENGSVRQQEMILRPASGEMGYYETNIEKLFINGQEYLLLPIRILMNTNTLKIN